MSVDSFPLLALPFFILAGNFMNNGGITKRLFMFANAILGSIRGGLGYVCIFSSILFSALSGSALANAAGLGTIQIKAMEDHGYDKDFAACLSASAAILGPIIPPSVIMIIYGVTAQVSIKRMFIGGIVPGLFLSLMYVIACYYYGRKLGLPKGEKFNLKTAWIGFKDSIFAILAPFIILGGIFSGIFTATEAGAVACVYSLVVGVLIYRDMKIRDIYTVMMEAGKTTGTILIIAATAALLGFCLTYSMVPQSLASVLVTHIENKYVLLVIFAIIYLILGCIMEASAIVITTIPIFSPLCNALGIDLVYFGVLIGIIMAVGTITPPVGTAMFVICKKSNIPIERFTYKMIPWFCIMFLFIIILIFMPDLITFLPNKFR
jgi:tripartite ATP-independent transporter DctM subunit